MSPEYSIQDIRTQNDRSITAALHTLQIAIASQLESQSQAHSKATLTLADTATINAQLDLIHSSFDTLASDTTKERAMIVTISHNSTPIAIRSYFYKTHPISPSYVFISSSLEVLTPFKKIGIGSTLLNNDRGFQEIAGQLVRLFNSQVTTVLASYSDQTSGEDRFWTTRRLSNERRLPLLNGSFKEEFPIPIVRLRA